MASGAGMGIGQHSADLEWWWDGAAWVPAWSGDRLWWYDGATWSLQERAAEPVPRWPPKRLTVLGVLIVLWPVEALISLIIYLRYVYQSEDGAVIPVQLFCALLLAPLGILLLVSSRGRETRSRMKPWDWFVWPVPVALAATPEYWSWPVITACAVLAGAGLALVMHGKRTRPSPLVTDA